MKQDNLLVVLVATRNPLNMGAAARAMSNFGFLRLRVVNPFAASFREAKSAVGASEVLRKAEVFDSVAEAVSDCALVVGTTAVGVREVQHPVHDAEVGAKLMRRKMAAGRVAILFGSEKFGLSNEDLSHCHWLVRIPTRLEHRSMNLGQAVAICMYEVARGLKPKSQSIAGAKKSATEEERERITEVLMETFRASGYWKVGHGRLLEEKWRRLVRRLQLSPEDAEIWLGMLRKILWKLKEGKEA